MRFAGCSINTSANPLRIGLFESPYKVLLHSVSQHLIGRLTRKHRRLMEICATRPVASWSTSCSPRRVCAPRHVLKYLCKQHPPTTGPPTSLWVSHWHICQSRSPAASAGFRARFGLTGIQELASPVSATRHISWLKYR